VEHHVDIALTVSIEERDNIEFKFPVEGFRIFGSVGSLLMPSVFSDGPACGAFDTAFYPPAIEDTERKVRRLSQRL
jgi:hypothetical protein